MSSGESSQGNLKRNVGSRGGGWGSPTPVPAPLPVTSLGLHCRPSPLLTSSTSSLLPFLSSLLPSLLLPTNTHCEPAMCRALYRALGTAGSKTAAVPSGTSQRPGPATKQIHGGNKDPSRSPQVSGENKTVMWFECPRWRGEAGGGESARGEGEPGRGSSLSKGPEAHNAGDIVGKGQELTVGSGQTEDMICQWWPDWEGGLRGTDGRVPGRLQRHTAPELTSTHCVAGAPTATSQPGELWEGPQPKQGLQGSWKPPGPLVRRRRRLDSKINIYRAPPRSPAPCWVT